MQTITYSDPVSAVGLTVISVWIDDAPVGGLFRPARSRRDSWTADGRLSADCGGLFSGTLDDCKTRIAETRTDAGKLRVQYLALGDVVRSVIGEGLQNATALEGEGGEGVDSAKSWVELVAGRAGVSPPDFRASFCEDEDGERRGVNLTANFPDGSGFFISTAG